MTLFSGGAPFNIANGIREFAQAQPEQAAVIDGDRTLTYAELDARTNRLAHVLLDAGLPTGTSVALLLGNRAEYMEAAAGIARAGLVMVPLNPRMTVPEVEYIVGHSEARAMILDDALSGVAASSTPGLDVVLSIDGSTLGRDYEDALAAADPTHPGVNVPETDPFCIAYTSGTTGRPKGVVISHRSRSITFYACAMEWGVGLGRRSIAVAPMYHGAGFCFGYAPVYTGGTVSMLRSWNPEALLQLIGTTARSRCSSSRRTHRCCVRSATTSSRSPTCRASTPIYFNAARAAVRVEEGCMRTLPGVGASRAATARRGGIMRTSDPADRRPGSGRRPPWFFTEVRASSPTGKRRGPGEPGELFSRSPFLMNGYLEERRRPPGVHDRRRLPHVRRPRGRRGRHRADRRPEKDMMISGGVNVYPRDVEEALATHPAIARPPSSACPDEKWGETVVAYVTVRDDEVGRPRGGRRPPAAAGSPATRSPGRSS